MKSGGDAERWRFARRGAWSAGAALLLSCSLLKSFDGFEGGEVADASTPPPASEAGDGGAPSCPRSSWPEPPPPETEGADVAAVVTAVQELQVFSTKGATRGFNLDALCTCPDAPSCRGSDSCDADGGVDNASASLFEQFARAGQTIVDDEGLRTGSKRGKYALLLRLIGYNGSANDPSVTLAILNAYELVSGDAGGEPRFDGNDEWRLDSESSPQDQFALYSSSRAWVTNNELVAEIPAAVLKLRVPATTGYQLIRLEFRELHLKTRLVPSRGSYTFTEGTLAGRWPAAAILKQVQINKVCADSPFYPTVKANICSARDVPLTPAEDGRDGLCRALSFGFGFTASPAKLGPSGTPTDSLGCPLVEDDCEE